MKRFWIALALLVFLFGLTQAHSYALGSFTASVNELLSQAEEEAQAGNWAYASELTAQAKEMWENQAFHLHTTLRHGDVDEVKVGFGAVEELLDCQEVGEYSAANARLMTYVALLSEMEALTWQNLF